MYLCVSKTNKQLEIMSKSIKLNSSQAMDIISALEIQIVSLKEDMDNSLFAVSDIEKDELKRMQKLVSTLDKAFWTKEGELK